MESPIAKRRCKVEIAKGDSLAAICDWSKPHAVAINHYDLTGFIKNITYSQLEATQLAVAGILRDTSSAHFIGITADTPSYCIPGLTLGIMLADRAFVCLPSSPLEAQRICDALGISHFLCSETNKDSRMIQNCEVHGTQIYLMQRRDSGDRIELAASNKFCGKFAYAVTTSGSTGEPKIVRITHDSIVPNIRDLKRIFSASESDTIAQMTPLTFDPSVVEIFLSLSCNGVLLTVSQGLKKDSTLLLKTLVESRVSIVQTTPSLLLHRWSSSELRNTILGSNSNLRILLFGGEPLPSMKILSKVRAPDNVTRIFDIYGITEVSCWATVREIRPGDPDPGVLGEILSETILEVRDESGKKIKEGEGILHIGSASRICVIDEEDLNSLSKPLFRDTGDIVKIDRRGRLTLEGRRGRRVKRYGTRLHLSELENHVSKLPFVENCYALFLEKDQSLHLYFTTCNDCPAGDDEKLRYEKDVLGHTMKLSNIYYPDEVCLLDQFELTPHGKICSRYLRRHSIKLLRSSRGSHNAEQDSIETFDELWRSSLPSGEDSGFLDSGGSSVVALRIASEMSEKVGHDFPELIGMLLTNNNLQTCRECVARQSSKLRSASFTAKDREATTTEISNSNVTNGLIHIEQNPAIFSSRDIRNSNNIAAWQKCRGRSSFPPDFEAEKEIVWDRSSKIHSEHLYPLGKCVDASPTIFCYPGGKSYVTVGSHSGMICTAELGKSSAEHWEITLPDRIEASVLILNDFRGVVGTYDGFVYCIHLKTGDIFWKFKTDDSIKCTAALCSKGKNIFFGSYDRYAYCVSLENGCEVWKLKAGNGSICATPCVNDDLEAVFFALLDGTCVSMKQSDGVINWKCKLDYPVFSAPVVLQIGVAIFCDVTGKVTGFVASTGEKTWSVETNGAIFSHLLIHTDERTDSRQSLVFASKNRYIYKLECSFSEKPPIFRLKKDIGVPVFSTPWSNGKVIVVVGIDGELKILDFFNGEELSRFKLGGDVFSSPIIHDDKIVVGCRDNNLYVLSITDSP